ncbi:MAG TPA: ABC transporter substrate-binding protein [Hyphomicrobiaceae bacterium]|jgi:NitT/TauT family transport system substrate-binding protein|nr:ABC transporter substrate-binding protein [Hyphomicrobiaceae bacterium]
MAVVLQETLRAVFYAPFYAALALDAYGQEGVDIRFVSSPTPSAAAKGLADGSVDVGWGGPMRVMLTNEKEPGSDLVCFCEVVTRDPFFLLGREPRPHFGVGDLMGRRVATVSEVPTPWLCLQEDLRRAGFDPAALDRITGRSMAENTAALRSGATDVVQVFQPFAEELIEDGGGHIWYAAASRGPTSYTTLYARRPVLDRRRDECLRMTRALYRTLKWVHASAGERIAAAIAPYFPDVPRQRLARALDRYKSLGIWGKDPRLPRSGYERLRAGMVSGGLIVAGTPYETAVDNSLAEKVMAEEPPALMS